MLPLLVLSAVALALLAAGAAPWAPPPRLLAALGGIGALAACAAALSAPASLHLGAVLAVDGLSAVALLAVSLLAAVAGLQPLLAGATSLLLLAGDAAGLTLAAVLTLLAAEPTTRLPGARWMRAVLIGALLALAAVALGGTQPAFATMRLGLPSGWGAVLAIDAVLAAAVLLAAVPRIGGLAAVYLVARLLLDLAGPGTAGWWGGPVLLLGAAAALDGARRTAAAPGLAEASDAASLAVAGLALLGLGTALLARGVDLLPLAGMAAAGALLLVLACALWAALLLACAAVVEPPGTGLDRMGGVLRRAPATGFAMLIGFASLAAVPLTPGFAGAWLVLQSALGAGRAGGLGMLLSAAGTACTLALAAAILGAAAVRLAGLSLLGAPRGARAAALVEPPRTTRLALAALVAASVAVGTVPGLALLLVRPGAALLAGAPVAAGGWLALGLPDAPGYAAPVLLLVLAAAVAVAGSTLRGPATTRAAPWQGGFAEDGIGRFNPGRVLPALPTSWPRPDTAVLALLALLAAVLLGWAAR